MDYNYKVSKSKNAGRKSWSLNFYHPMIIDDKTGEPIRVRKGAGTDNDDDVNLIISDLEKLINNVEYHNSAMKEKAKLKEINAKAIEIFYSDIYIKNKKDYDDIKEKFIPLSKYEKNKIVDIEGFSGAGKTTLLEQLLGLDIEKEHVLATSVNKTTVSTNEFIVSNQDVYEIVCTFKERIKIEIYVRELVERAIYETIIGSPYDEIGRKFIESKNKEFRLNYLLGNIDMRSKNNSSSNYLDKFSQYENIEIINQENSNNIDLQKLLEELINQVRKDWNEFIKSEDKKIIEMSEKEKIDLINKFVIKYEKSDEYLNFVEDIMEKIDEKVTYILTNEYDIKEQSKEKWVEYIHMMNLDRTKCLSMLKKLTTNDAKLHGNILTPIVDSIRVSGPFVPWWVKKREEYNFTFVDGRGLDHILEEAFSIPPEIDEKLYKADKILWVHDGSEAMRQDSKKFFEHIEVSGYTNRTYICFTHFDMVKGGNLSSAQSKASHIVSNMEQVLSLLDESKRKSISRKINNKLIFVGNINNKLNEKDDIITLKELDDLVIKLKLSEEEAILYDKELIYYDYLLSVDLIESTERYNKIWNSLLGIINDENIPSLPWQTIKALARRYAEFNELSFGGISPAGDMQKCLSECIYKLLSKPNYFQKDFDIDEEELEKIREILMREINKRIRDFCKERILLNDKQASLWHKAYYDRRGDGSTTSRTYDIKEINENAVPRYIISDENKSLKEFIFLLRKEILEVFKDINSRYKTRIDLD